MNNKVIIPSYTISDCRDCPEQDYDIYFETRICTMNLMQLDKADIFVGLPIPNYCPKLEKNKLFEVDSN